ncbi:hypothetical protein BGZ80_002465 [Entomortierella chlamydospora]|uniref:Scramblase family protein n=1 Tax=Entomortierella chlamydospora TaxID=101097 RepID=A0A9P6N172_9FUNG|nr:hypothetical protein BGZ79_006969 [Entomortierella chlamydospora]KAG0021408.1 hypothetical protein BGZ80_002465 [Entomortierella chlamydospora]
MFRRAVPTTATLLVAQTRTRAGVAIRQSQPLRTGRLASSQYNNQHYYSSLRRRAAHNSKGGRISARAVAPARTSTISHNNGSSASSNAAPLAGAASVLNRGAHDTHVAATPQEQAQSNVVQGLDIAATPAVVPEDPFGVLQPYHSAAKLLTQPALIMTRQIEMMNLLVGFEQANKYAIVDPSGTSIGYIAEEDTTFVKAMSRQVFRTHRPFKASVLDLEGNEVLRIHRPFAFINSRIMISTPDDRLIGEVQQEWHLIRRRYNLFTVEQPDPKTMQKDGETTAISTDRNLDGKGMNRVQFAHIDGGFLALDFDMQDEQGQKMGSVNRNFVGFARELFTDSGQYALRFDAAVVQDLQQQQGLGATPANGEGLQQAKEIQANKDETALAQLESRGGLTLDQRAIMLACAVSIDFDYFSRHSGNGGIMPIPMMMGGGHAPVPSNSSDDVAGGVGGAVAGAAAGNAAGEAVSGGFPTPPSATPSGPNPTEGGAWGNQPPTPTNSWGEEVWAEDSDLPEDSGDSWFGGDKGDSGGGGGGFDWNDLL